MVDKINNNNTIKKSPILDVSANDADASEADIQKPTTANSVLRRNNRGCKSSDFYNWSDQPLDQMDTPLSVQQYIQQTIRKNPADIDTILKPPEGQDIGAWKMEHLRQFCMQFNGLAVKLQAVCDLETCKQMTATDQWIFLCAAHKQPVECPAIDYTRHTLDGACCLLNSNKYFPSRVTIKDSSVAKLGSVCRRVYRIFSHAFYHHRAVFEEFESETFLCKRFTAFVTMYGLMANETLIVPIDRQAAFNNVTSFDTTPPPSTEATAIPTATATENQPISSETETQLESAVETTPESAESSTNPVTTCDKAALTPAEPAVVEPSST